MGADRTWVLGWGDFQFFLARYSCSELAAVFLATPGGVNKDADFIAICLETISNGECHSENIIYCCIREFEAHIPHSEHF